jgi:leucyl aminopeptidase
VEHFAARANAKTIPIVPMSKADFKVWLAKQSKMVSGWLKANNFKANASQIAVVPGRDGNIARIVFGLGSSAPDLWRFASLTRALPKGTYALESHLGKKGSIAAEMANAAALGWGMAAYRFRELKTAKAPRLPKLVWPENCDRKSVTATLEATYLVRDLVNRPAGHLGPRELAAEAEALADRHEAKVTVIEGGALLDNNYPAIHAVGRGSERPPCLADLRWGDEKHPRLTLVGKGVVFDSGGLDLKSAIGMKLMKKDMGGAAHALGLAHMVMSAGLKVNLRVLIPCVENSVAGDAYRPLDVIDTRKGITVEVGNTDAEGRIILCDALAEADSESPDLLIDFATLTGAARVAVGTEIGAVFCDDDELASQLVDAGGKLSDPLWRMPLHRAYRRFLDSRVADMNNIASVPQGGAITAALFLKEFISNKTTWVHYDVMAYNNQTRPGRPPGGEAMGLRATFDVLAARYG